MDKKVGRPSKAELAATGNMTKRQQAAALKEYRQRLLCNPKSERLIEELFNTALDPEAKNQGVAMKILADRILPVAGFTADGKQQAQVSINISGIGAESNAPGVTINGGSGEVEEDN